MLTCGLYCLLRFPDTSLAHGMTRRLKTGLPFAVTLTGFGLKSFWTISLWFKGAFWPNLLMNPPCPSALISGYINCSSLAGTRIISFLLTRYFPLYIGVQNVSMSLVLWNSHIVRNMDFSRFSNLFFHSFNFHFASWLMTLTIDHDHYAILFYAYLFCPKLV